MCSGGQWYLFVHRWIPRAWDSPWRRMFSIHICWWWRFWGSPLGQGCATTSAACYSTKHFFSWVTGFLRSGSCLWSCLSLLFHFSFQEDSATLWTFQLTSWVDHILLYHISPYCLLYRFSSLFPYAFESRHVLFYILLEFYLVGSSQWDLCSQES